MSAKKNPKSREGELPPGVTIWRGGYKVPNGSAERAPSNPSTAGWTLSHDNHKRWMIVGPDNKWTMQPVGMITAAEAEQICREAIATASVADTALVDSNAPQSNSVGDNKMSDADDDVPSPVWTGRLWIGQRPGEGANVTRIERVAEIWRGQGLTVTPIFATTQPPAAEVAIELLKWKPHPAGGEQAVAAGIALYRIHENGDDWYLDRDHMGKGGKAAAQAHFAKSIRSALVSATASPRQNDDARLDQVLRERDEYHEAADRLAQAIANHFGIDIGEHSNINHPWINALETIEARSATASLPDGWVAVPEEPTLEWAHDMATRWQGQSETPRCEAPSDYDITLCFERIKLAIATRPPPPPTQATGETE